MRYFKSRYEAAWYWFSVAFCTCGLGLFPRKIGRKLKGGGIIGSAVGLGIAAILEHTGYMWVAIALAPALFGLAMLCIPPAECFLAIRWGALRRHKGEEEVTRDYNVDNIDEVIPGLIFGLVAHLHGDNWWVAAGGMTIIFRFVDAYKIWPVNIVEKWAKRWYPLDVLLDDIVGMVETIAIYELGNWYFNISPGIPFLD